MLTAREEWILEGEMKGQMKGKMEGEMKGQIVVIDNLIQSGMDWNIIANATGVDQKGFEKMRLDYQHLCSQSDNNQQSAQYATTSV
ncbi:MAG: hypothetical protein OMM_11695 [Candidatus Magnetoglobus multicellularis str. Araruama]|uniref:Uncharacterized protein n=1 Tax=Candidatus Magnetoglobus multicellularis str. Araruama TaxID=890399 RepID=A0A1V1NXS2_9BACT|nr:MAG: hypothetical protein OMM_11695 [Candidatus Magnetoglobus multicellularis str. Araruama]